MKPYFETELAQGGGIMAEDREITVHIEIPVRVYFSTHPAEARTNTYPGREASLQVERCELDFYTDTGPQDDIDQYMHELHGDYIHEQCVDAVERESKEINRIMKKCWKDYYKRKKNETIL